MSPRGMVRTLASWLSTLGAGGSGAPPSTDPLRTVLPAFFRRIRNPPVHEKIATSLPQLIAQCRYLECAVGAARGIVNGAKADLVGTGIDVEPKCSDEDLRALLRQDWLEWAEDCTADGRTLWDCQRTARAEWMVAGANIWVWRVMPERLAKGKLPLVIQELEVEWLTDLPVQTVDTGNTFVAGVEFDALGRPVWYHVRSPENLGGLLGERLAAALVDHGYDRRRPRQMRGEPEFAPVIERLQQDDQLVTIELRSASATSAPSFVIKSDEEHITPDTDLSFAPGSAVRVGVQEEVTAFVNPRPNQLIAPFRSVLRGDEAAATGVSQQWIDRDSGRANYSSSRMDELLTQRLNAPLRNLFGKFTATCPYHRLIPWILLRRGRVMPSAPAALADLYRHEIIPDEAESVDRSKAADASQKEIALGLSTKEREAGRRSLDWRKIIEQQAREQEAADIAAVERVKALQKAIDAAGVPGLHWSQIVTVPGAISAPGAYLGAINPPAANDAGDGNSTAKGASNAEA